MPETGLRKLDLELLVVLRTVVETRNVTAAARRLHMSQPAVSRALTRLRLVFGDQLFVKGPGGVIPTARADELADVITRLLAEIGAAVERPVFDPSSSNRVFRIATTDYGSLAVLTPAIAALAQEAPGVGIDIVPLTGASFDDLGTANVDFALYSDDPVPPKLRRLVLFDETYISLVRAGHPAVVLVQNGMIAKRDFLRYGHILVTVAGDRSGVVDDALSATGDRRYIAVALPYFSAAGVLAAKTDLILTLPRRAAAAMSAELGLASLLPPVNLPSFSYQLLWHARSDADPGAVWFREQLAGLVGSH